MSLYTACRPRCKLPKFLRRSQDEQGWGGAEGNRPERSATNKRAMALLDRLSARPTARIPAACSGWSLAMAAYALFCNDDVTWEGILAPHWSCSRTRIVHHRDPLFEQEPCPWWYEPERGA